MIRSHVFASSGEAYTASKTCDAIRDGDVLLVPSEDLAGVLVGAWPVVVGNNRSEDFDWLREGATWLTLDGGRYRSAATVAIVLLTVHAMTTAGLGTNQPLLDIARQQGWAGEYPAQERFNTERDDSWGAG
jgi:hypothetical protein